jgi:hypothetical protein
VRGVTLLLKLWPLIVSAEVCTAVRYGSLSTKCRRVVHNCVTVVTRRDAEFAFECTYGDGGPQRDPESTPREKATNPLCRALVTMIVSESQNEQVSPLLLLLLLLLCALLLLSNPSLQETQSLSMLRGSCCNEARSCYSLM